MSLFKTDPLLAFCRLIAWFFLFWIVGGALVTLCASVVTLVNGDFVVRILRTAYPKLQDDGLLVPLFCAFAFMFAGIALLGRFMLYLLDIIRSVGNGEAFTQLNADRIRRMAWISLLGMPFGFCIATALGFVVNLLGPRDAEAGIRIETFDGGFTMTHILMTLLLFVLARLFAQAASMRDEIEGTV